MTSNNIVRVNDIIVGVLLGKPDGRKLVFHASHEAFNSLNDSSFPNRYAAQRAVDRIAHLQGVTTDFGSSGREDEAIDTIASWLGGATGVGFSRGEDEEVRAIRSAMS